MSLGVLELNEARHVIAGNWQHFKCFAWFRRSELKDARAWAVIYTQHRDSGLVDQSNAAVIDRAMKPFTEGKDPDVIYESHSHWAVGHVDGFSVRVFRDGRVTKAFQTYHALARQIEDYRILDESDYSEREFEATLENIGDGAWRVRKKFDLPEGWEFQVYSWLSDNCCREIENVDDQGGYPGEEALLAAFEALGFESQTEAATA